MDVGTQVVVGWTNTMRPVSATRQVFVLATGFARAHRRQSEQALVPELRAVAVVTVLQVAENFVSPLVIRFVQQYVNNEAKPPFRILVTRLDGGVQACELTWTQPNLAMTTKATYSGVITEILWAGRLSKE